MKIQDLEGAYLNYRQFTKLVTTQTLETDKKRLPKLIEFWLNREVESLTIKDIEDYKAEMVRRGNQPSYIRAHVLMIKAFFVWLRKQGYAVLDPKTIQNPRVPRREIDYLTPQDVETMLNHFSRASLSDLCMQSLLRIMLDSGMRIFECLKLNRNDIDFNKGSAFIEGKGRKMRMVMFTEWSIMCLKSYLEERTDDNPAMFVAHHFNRYGIHQRLSDEGVRKRLRKVGIKMGKRLTPHGMRRTSATNLYQKSHDYKLVQDHLGHESIVTTMKYVGIDYVQQQLQFLKHMAWAWHSLLKVIYY